MKIPGTRRRQAATVGTVLLMLGFGLIGTTSVAGQPPEGQGAAGMQSQGHPAPPAAVTMSDVPDIVLYNGKVSTVDATNSEVEAVAIRDGKIIATGKSGPVRGLAKKGTVVLDLGGRRVLPGLIDATLHGIRTGYHCYTRSVRHDATFTRADAISEYTRIAAQNPPGTWIFTSSGSYHVNQFDLPGMFTLAELDAAAPNHPVFVQASGFTGVQVNSLGLATLGLAAGDAGVVLDGAGQPTGQLVAPANGLASRAVGTQLQMMSTEEQADCLAAFMREVNRRGLTAWDDPGGNDPFDPNGSGITVLRDNHGYQAVNLLHREGRMTTRVTFNLSCFGPDARNEPGLPDPSGMITGALDCVKTHTFNALSGIGDDMLRLSGIGEDVMQATGGIYADPLYSEILLHLAANDWRFQHHASQPITQLEMVNTWERVNAVEQMDDLGWFMLHPGGGPDNPNDFIFSKLRELGAGIVLTDSGVRAGGSPPYRRAYESGTQTCLGTDALNASPYPPFVNIWFTVSGDTFSGAPGVVPEQRLSRQEALEMATRKCGWFLDLEDKIGSIEVGKYADLIVLRDDYFTVPVDDIRTLTSVLTIVDGRIVYADDEFAGLDGS